MDPAAALRYLKEMSADVREAVLLDGGGALVAATLEGGAARRMAGRALALLELAAAAAPDREPPRQVEATTAEGEVFAYGDGERTLVAVTGRGALPALMFTDMRMTLRDIQGAA